MGKDIQDQGLSPEEKAQIEYLRKRKSDIIENLVYTCEEINRQIADVKAGRWLKAIKEYDEKCAVCVEFGSKWCADCTEQGGRYNYFKVR